MEQLVNKRKAVPHMYCRVCTKLMNLNVQQKGQHVFDVFYQKHSLAAFEMPFCTEEGQVSKHKFRGAAKVLSLVMPFVFSVLVSPAVLLSCVVLAVVFCCWYLPLALLSHGCASSSLAAPHFPAEGASTRSRSETIKQLWELKKPASHEQRFGAKLPASGSNSDMDSLASTRFAPFGSLHLADSLSCALFRYKYHAKFLLIFDTNVTSKFRASALATALVPLHDCCLLL